MRDPGRTSWRRLCRHLLTVAMADRRSVLLGDPRTLGSRPWPRQVAPPARRHDPNVRVLSPWTYRQATTTEHRSFDIWYPAANGTWKFYTHVVLIDKVAKTTQLVGTFPLGIYPGRPDRATARCGRYHASRALEDRHWVIDRWTSSQCVTDVTMHTQNQSVGALSFRREFHTPCHATRRWPGGYGASSIGAATSSGQFRLASSAKTIRIRTSLGGSASCQTDVQPPLLAGQ
jgi:hypothetical protein